MAKARIEYLYGLNPAFEVLRAGRRAVKTAFLDRATKGRPRLKKLAALLERRAVFFEWVEKGRLTDLAKSREHQGVVLRADNYPYVPFASLLEGEKLLLLDNIEDPHNVGAILRSAEVFGFHSVLLPNKGVPEVYPSVVKVSAGATEFLRIARETSSNRYAIEAKEHGFQVVALEAKGKTAINDLKSKSLEKLLLVVGGEDKAVGQFILNLADYVVRIEQKGKVNSLNASVAAAIAMCAFAE